MALPSGYTPLEYIESTGSQYVDTGIADPIKFVADIQFTSTGARALMGYGSEAGQYFGINANDFLELGPSVISSVSGTKRNTVTFEVGSSATTLTANGVTISRARTTAIDTSFKIFGDLAEYPCPGKIFSGEVYVGGTLVRDYIPVQRLDGAVGLLDQVNNVFYPDAAGGNFIPGPDVTWTELEYIESTGTQYVDTKFVPNQDARVTVDFEAAANASGHVAFFGARQGTSSSTFAVWLASGVVNPQYGSVAYNTKTLTLDYVKRLTCDFNKNIFAVGGQTATFATATFSAGATLCLLSVNTAGTVDSRMAAGKLYSCQIYDNGNQALLLVPAMRTSGEVGLIDTLTGFFYGNSGTGAFIAGPLAAKPEAPASLEVIGTTRNAAILAWPGAPVGQSYRLYRDGVVVYEGSALCYTDTGLAAGSTHVYSIHTLGGSTESEGVTTEATTTEGIVLITDRTAGDVSAGRRKGYYNALDLIRVGEAMAYLEERFAAVGISLSVSPKLDWKLSDIPTQVQMLHYLEDVGVLRDKLMKYRETVSSPDSLNALTWASANDIETILLDVENLIHTIILSYRHYSGRTISGVNVLP